MVLRVIPFIKNKLHFRQGGALIFDQALLAPKQLTPKGIGDAGGSKISGCPIPKRENLSLYYN